VLEAGHDVCQSVGCALSAPLCGRLEGYYVGRYPYRWEIIIVCLVCLNENRADPEGFSLARLGESKVLKFKRGPQLWAAFARSAIISSHLGGAHGEVPWQLG
jgi:hypothetical protein